MLPKKSTTFSKNVQPISDFDEEEEEYYREEEYQGPIDEDDDEENNFAYPDDEGKSKKPIKQRQQSKKKAVKFEEEKQKKKPSIPKKTQKAILVFNKLVDDAIQKIIFSMADQEYVSDIYLDYVCQLLQPQHFEEVLEERNASGLCGNPTCSNEIDDELIGRNPKYYIDFNRLELVDVSSFANRLFCCEVCKKKSFQKMNACSTSIPYTRDCKKLLFMLFPEIGEERLTFILDQVKESVLTDPKATLAVKVKENENPQLPAVGAEDELDCETDNIEGFIPSYSNDKIKKEVKRIGYFFEPCSDSDGTGDGIDPSELKLELFQELWTFFSRMVTKSTVQYFKDLNNPSQEAETSQEVLPKKEKSKIDYSELKVYEDMYKEMGIDISNDIEQFRPTNEELYSEDGGVIRDEVHMVRFRLFLHSLYELIPTICDSIGYTNHSKLRLQFEKILSTFNYEYALPSLDLKRLKIICTVIVKTLMLKDEEFKQDLIEISEKPIEFIILGQKPTTPVQTRRKKITNEKDSLLEKSTENINNQLLKEGIKEVQINLLTDVIIFGVY
ncbi:hypothetical protein NAEGRDRAFT_80617 [Naegleria gruberi]|uniref:RNA polymerase II subunit B1 CTD phosphatase RPAP2 homolog n=1 Tax=Naegleria gruberi TaxID=5762 RepID=D2VN68_NAEGR|nr:uncharacterized protein NAEGRDRAFT_80617 [Naegleria gruberi]EFC41599.1 hypothetical protein NAEGRDRAFT_80617 [Naegleria gruberi]|eukprot:XP_002674343.1 hypothetical protein NAEGRDRAFT_80617 [Naegleria gruberi strain NEG-M]